MQQGTRQSKAELCSLKKKPKLYENATRVTPRAKNLLRGGQKQGDKAAIGRERKSRPFRLRYEENDRQEDPHS